MANERPIKPDNDHDTLLRLDERFRNFREQYDYDMEEIKDKIAARPPCPGPLCKEHTDQIKDLAEYKIVTTTRDKILYGVYGAILALVGIFLGYFI